MWFTCTIYCNDEKCIIERNYFKNKTLICSKLKCLHVYGRYHKLKSMLNSNTAFLVSLFTSSCQQNENTWSIRIPLLPFISVCVVSIGLNWTLEIKYFKLYYISYNISVIFLACSCQDKCNGCFIVSVYMYYI